MTSRELCLTNGGKWDTVEGAEMRKPSLDCRQGGPHDVAQTVSPPYPRLIAS